MENFTEKIAGQEELGIIFEELKSLSSIESLSTQESGLRDYLLTKAESFGLMTRVDTKGNLWFISEAPEGEITLCSHMDRIGQSVNPVMENGTIVGRLDDSLGISLILSLYKSGLRPSAVFTVEEESEQEQAAGDGSIQIIPRDLPNGIYNAGARKAAGEIYTGRVPNPKMVVIVDVSTLGTIGGGPIIYTSSMGFRYPKDSLIDLARVVNRAKLGVVYQEGMANDSIEFTFIPGKNVGVAAVEVHTDNMHSNREIVSIEDVLAAQDALREIIINHEKIRQPSDVPTHTKPKSKPIEMPLSS